MLPVMLSCSHNSHPSGVRTAPHHASDIPKGGKRWRELESALHSRRRFPIQHSLFQIRWETEDQRVLARSRLRYVVRVKLQRDGYISSIACFAMEEFQALDDFQVACVTRMIASDDILGVQLPFRSLVPSHSSSSRLGQIAERRHNLLIDAACLSFLDFYDHSYQVTLKDFKKVRKEFEHLIVEVRRWRWVHRKIEARNLL